MRAGPEPRRRAGDRRRGGPAGRACWPGCRCPAARRTSCSCWSSRSGWPAAAVAGLAAGFGAGLLTDLLSDHPVGVLALCFALAGLLAGLLEADVRRSVLLPVVVVAVADRRGLPRLPRRDRACSGSRSADGAAGVLGTVAYDVVLTPFVVPLVAGGDQAVRPGEARAVSGEPTRSGRGDQRPARGDPRRGGLAAAHPRRPALLPAGARRRQAGPDGQPAAHPRGHPGRPARRDRRRPRPAAGDQPQLAGGEREPVRAAGRRPTAARPCCSGSATLLHVAPAELAKRITPCAKGVPTPVLERLAVPAGAGGRRHDAGDRADDRGAAGGLPGRAAPSPQTLRHYPDAHGLAAHCSATSARSTRTSSTPPARPAAPTSTLNAQVGRAGLEKTYDAYLRGKPTASGASRSTTAARASAPSGRPTPSAGDTLVTSIDRDVQRIAEQALTRGDHQARATER